MAFLLYFDIKHTPEIIGMSPRWVRDEIRKGMPCLRTAGKILLDPVRVREWMESHYTKKPTDLDEAVRVADELTPSQNREKGAHR